MRRFVLRWSLLAAIAVWAAPAAAQQLRFSTPLTATTPVAAPAGTTAVYQNPGVATYAAPPAYAPPAVAPSYTMPPTGAPTYPGSIYPQPSTSPTWVQPPGAPTVQPAPYATLNGGIQTPPPNWDPYATPGSQPQTLLSQDPYPTYGGPNEPFTFSKMQKFINNIHLDYDWMPGGGDNEMGVNEFDTGVTFAIPMFYNAHTPLLVTPSFGAHWFDGPSGPAAVDVPPHVFDAYLLGEWDPKPTKLVGGELAFSVGVYSDFKKLNSASVRYKGKGLLVLSFSKSIELKGGIYYLDRNRVKLLPAGGLLWTPTDDLRADIFFPAPKISRRFRTLGATDWWLYLRGEYGDGSWTNEVDSGIVSFDYNDIRVAVGIDFISPTWLSGYFEVGGAFNREIYYDANNTIPLNSCVFLGGGVKY